MSRFRRSGAGRALRIRARLLSVVAASAVCFAASRTADALAFVHFDAFVAAVTDRLQLYPDPPADAAAKKLRAALLKAQSALAEESESRDGDLAAAKRAAGAVERPFALDEALLAALDGGLDLHAEEMDAERDTYDRLINDAPLGKLRTKLERARTALDDALADAATSPTRKRRASDLARAAKGLRKVRTPLYDGDCPRVLGVYFTGLGTMTFDDGGGDLVATDCEFTVNVVQGQVTSVTVEGSVAGHFVRLTFAGAALAGGQGTPTDPQGTDGTLSGAYQTPTLSLQAVNGSATVDEFRFEPVPENAYVGAWGAGYKDAAGRIRGTFTYTFCQQVSFPGEVCGGAARTLNGSFDVCNPVIFD